MKKILWTSVLVVGALIFGSLFLLRELTYAQMPDLKTAARIALDHSAIVRIESVQPYTGGPYCYAFSGRDKLGREMIVFANKDKVLGFEYREKGLPMEKVEQKARQEAGFAEVKRIVPGVSDPNANRSLAEKASGNYVWEIYGTNSQGQKQYAYLDFYTGNVIRTYVLK